MGHEREGGVSRSSSLPERESWSRDWELLAAAGICGLRLGERLCVFVVEEAAVAAERLPKTRRTRFWGWPGGGVLAGDAICLQSGCSVIPAFPFAASTCDESDHPPRPL